MIVFMVDKTQGHARVGALVKAVMAWEGITGPKLAAGGARPAIATINRIRAGEMVSDSMLRAMGDRLRLPKDFLLYVRDGDLERIRSSGADDDLIRWTVDLVEADQTKGGDTAQDAAG